jgi:hypothetical protein
MKITNGPFFANLELELELQSMATDAATLNLATCGGMGYGCQVGRRGPPFIEWA